MILHFYLIARREEGVKPNDEFGMTTKEVRDSRNYTRSIDTASEKKYTHEGIISV
jgi:hypothetical protein